MPLWSYKRPGQKVETYTGDVLISGGALMLGELDQDDAFTLSKSYAPSQWEWVERQPEPES